MLKIKESIMLLSVIILAIIALITFNPMKNILQRMNMKVNNKTHISMTDNDVRDIIIKYLYQNQGLSGIFDVKFKLRKKSTPSQYPQDCNYITEFDGAEITVDLNEK